MNIFIYDEAIYPIIIRQNIPWREKGGVKKPGYLTVRLTVRAYRLAKLYTGYMALGYIARHTWLYSHWLFSHVYMAI